MLKKEIGAVCCCCICVVGVVGAQEREYVSHGPPESAPMEKALHGLLPGYEYGIAPRGEILERGIRKNDIPAAYVSKIEFWIDRVVRPEFRPKSGQGVFMVGLPRLHQNRDYIFGRVACASCDAPDLARAVEFHADDRNLDLTFHSSSLKVPRAGVWSGPQIVAAVTRFLDIPEAKIPRIVVEHHVAEVDDVRVYYGKLHCEWDYLRPDDKLRKWWSYVPFWVTDGTLYVSVSIIDWEHGETPAAAVNAGLNLIGAVRTDGE